MTTFGQIVYSVLDLLKEHSDDAYYTEEHVIFLASKMRAFLIDKKYKNSRNTSFLEESRENEQQICLELEPSSGVSGCSSGWLKSKNKVPKMLGSHKLTVYPLTDVRFTTVSYIPVERMPYIGHNKWLSNIIYCALSDDGYIYLHGQNPQFMYMERLKASGVFSDPEKAAEFACDKEGNIDNCSILDKVFPLEEALIPSCIEMVVQELTGARYAPEDKKNDGKDGLGEAGVTKQTAAKPTQQNSSE